MSPLLPPITLHAADRRFPLELATMVHDNFTIKDVVALLVLSHLRHYAKQVLTYSK